jgi:PIN domain nuclease of toxin-antitoxin system
VRVLVDTHTLLWAKISPEKLSRHAAEIIADPLNVIFVSAVSAWEIATKVRLGKLPGFERLERDLLEVMEESGYTLLSIEAQMHFAPAALLHLIAILSIVCSLPRR